MFSPHSLSRIARISSKFRPNFVWASELGQMLPHRSSRDVCTLPDATTSSSLALSAAAKAPLVGGVTLTILKVAPVVTCQALWLAPLPTIQEVEKNGTTAGLPPLPYFSMFANGFLWVIYGCTASFDPTIIIPNFTGFLAGGYYTSKFIQNTSGQFKLTPYYAGTAGVMGVVSGCYMLLPGAEANQAIGLLGCGVVAAMLGGPLQVIKTVLKEKSTRSLPFPMAVATLVNSAFWFSYGQFVIFDPYVWGPNAVGVVSGVIQLSLFARFGIQKPDGDKDVS